MNKIIFQLLLSLIFIPLNIFAGRKFICQKTINLNCANICNLYLVVNSLPACNTKRLILSNNKIKNIDDLFKLDEKFENLKYINLSNNEITTIENIDFNQLQNKFCNIKELHLCRNKLDESSKTKIILFNSQENNDFKIIYFSENQNDMEISSSDTE